MGSVPNYRSSQQERKQLSDEEKQQQIDDEKLNRVSEDSPEMVGSSSDAQTFKSFQYSYNSNTISLFSSKKTVSTGFSTQPSSSYYSYKKSHQQSLQSDQSTHVNSVGLPLRVVHEEELEEEQVPVEDRRPSVYRPIVGRRRSNFDDSHFVKIDRTDSSSTAAGLGSSSSPLPAISTSTAQLKINDYEKQQLKEFISRQLKQLSIAMANILIQVSQSVLNLTKASISVSECIKNTTRIISLNDSLPLLEPYQFSTMSSVGLRRVIKYVLFVMDNLLTDEVYNNSKSLTLKSLYDLFITLKLIEPSPADVSGITSYLSIMSPQLFPIGSTVQDFQDQEKVNRIMESMTSKPKQKLFSDQDGSFIAPVLRGFNNENLAIVTFIFGFPEPTREHRDVIKYFSTNSEDMHFLVLKDSIVPASSAAVQTEPLSTEVPPTMRFKSPFRVTGETENVPISMSIACSNALTLSGTLGGYLYPKVPKDCGNPKLLKYQGSIFGLTCAHLVLNQTTLAENNGNPYPFVSVPSPVLINLYKNALSGERLKYTTSSAEYKAYDDAVKNLDTRFPVQEVRIKKKRYKRNLPAERFGQIVWGERIIKEDKLSDLAIIKVNIKKEKKYLNYLGEDLNLSQYDPSLILSNLYVKKVINLGNRKNGLLDHSNLRVFKVGSTTNYTVGQLNGMKMIYWSEGSLKTSEFVISGSNKKNFASGGDSGAFILTKLSDLSDNTLERSLLRTGENDTVYPPGTARKSVLSSFIESFIPSLGERFEAETEQRQSGDNDSVDSTGLGLVGMLHSYDGELKQFGLFSPMSDILDRLKGVTGLEWGVVGCEDSNDEENNDSEEIYEGDGEMADDNVD
ncbi:DEKNAAC104934 [Brettanomyces naardenensis]|uniref:DEKNAAC104934 n=1 Tax=Brettanomyces naardenensis TaxID=13370 RepID=A0A448YRZ7_BRENA|nr:DEKNAAC104934 [Brettanomyces naardenensis]